MPDDAADLNLSDQLRLRIEEDILTGQLLPGDRLDERSLAERYGMSRTPVRQALLQLASTGLVTARPRQPTIVTPLGLSRFVQMIEVMRFTEAHAAAFAARRMPAQKKRDLIAIHEASRASVEHNDLSGFEAKNWALHQAIFQGSGNGFLAEQARLLRVRLHPYRRLLLRISGRMAGAFDEHRVIIEAILAGDADRAYEAMADHLEIDGALLTDFASILPDQDALHSALTARAEALAGEPPRPARQGSDHA